MNNLKTLETLLAKQGFVPLEETKEGLLRGGFAALAAKVGNNCDCETLTNNCKCNGNNCSCPPSSPPNNCECNGNNCNCYKTEAVPTAAPTTLAPPKQPAPGMGFVFGF